MTKYNTYILQNGLRLIHLPSASQVVYCGYDIAAGTRDERLRVGDGTAIGEEGLAHFCERLHQQGGHLFLCCHLKGALPTGC